MLSGFVNALRQNTGIHLTLIFSIIFMVGYGVLFFLSTYLLSSSLQNKEQNLILTRINRYTELETEKGYDKFFKIIQRDRNENSKLGLLVQITGTNGGTELLTTPYNWVGVRTNLDDWSIVPDEGQWFTLKRIDSGDEDELFLTSRILTNDYVLQVDRSTIERDSLISNFQAVFSRFMIPFFYQCFAGSHIVLALFATD